MICFVNTKIGLPFCAQVQESVEEVENSGFLATSSTLDVKLMANNKILQVRSTFRDGSRVPGCSQGRLRKHFQAEPGIFSVCVAVASICFVLNLL